MPSENEATTTETPAGTSGTETSGSGADRGRTGTTGRSSRNTRPDNRTPRPAVSNFKGAVPDVGAVIGTKTESMTMGSFKIFQGKSVGYIMEKYTHPRDIAPVVRDLVDMSLDNQEPEDPAVDATTTRVQSRFGTVVE